MSEGLIRAVLAEATKLGLAWWERILLVLAAALVRVLAKRAGKSILEALKRIKIEEQVVMDEGGPQHPGTPFPTDPDHPGSLDGGGG